jgi:hypothetical protein
MDERAMAVQRLIGDSARGAVTLTVLTGLDLCALGAGSQAIFDAAVTVAWGALAGEARDSAQSDTLAGLVRRELLHPAAAEAGGYIMATELSVVMGARADPTFALVTEVEGADVRSVKMFGLGDKDRPLQAVVVESPIAAPKGDFGHLARLGPLGWFYRYTLVSPAAAADILVRWTELDLPRRGTGYAITTFRHPMGSGLTGDVVTVSRKKKLARNGEQLDAASLRDVVSGLVAAS